MILLDTNVISETVKASPSADVITWLNGQVSSDLFLSSVTIGEMCFGIQAMPDGKRKATLASSFDAIVNISFAGRLVSYDSACSRIYGERMAIARNHGRAVAVADGQIAAIALAHGYCVATRDTAPFRAMGVVSVIDPWANCMWKLNTDIIADPTQGAYSYLQASLKP